jgi:hypothetical protein
MEYNNISENASLDKSIAKPDDNTFLPPYKEVRILIDKLMADCPGVIRKRLVFNDGR